MTITITKETITPAKAKLYLNANKSNRTLRDGVVEQYAADMKAGRWTSCPAPICFYEDGDLGDGQHRLWAIIESETPQTFFVARGYERKDGLNFDTQLPRTLVDNAKISGVDPGLTNSLLAVARMFEQGERQVDKISNARKLDMVSRWREPCEWAIKYGPRGRGLSGAALVAAVARAYAHVKGNPVQVERLKHFGEVLSKGFSDGDADTAGVALRNYVLANVRQFGYGAGMRELFLKTQNVIKYFLAGKRLTVIKNVTDEAYPLPRQRKLAA